MTLPSGGEPALRPSEAQRQGREIEGAHEARAASLSGIAAPLTVSNAGGGTLIVVSVKLPPPSVTPVSSS